MLGDTNHRLLHRKLHGPLLWVYLFNECVSCQPNDLPYDILKRSEFFIFLFFNDPVLNHCKMHTIIIRGNTNYIVLCHKCRGFFFQGQLTAVNLLMQSDCKHHHFSFLWEHPPHTFLSSPETYLLLQNQNIWQEASGKAALWPCFNILPQAVSVPQSQALTLLNLTTDVKAEKNCSPPRQS